MTTAVPSPAAGPMAGPTTSPTARALRRHLRRVHRSSPAARPIGETLQDVYVALFGAVVVVAMCAPLARSALQDVAGRPSLGHGSALLAPALGVALALAAGGTALRVLVLVGPVVQDPGRATWLLASPVPRAGLLAPSAVLLAVVATVVGAVVGLAAGVLGGVAPGWSASAGALVGLLLVAVAVEAQGRRPAARRTARRVGDVVAVAAAPVLLLGLDAGSPVSTHDRSDDGAGRTLAAAVVAVAVLLVVVGSVRAPAALRRLRRADLVAGAGLATGLRATVTALDGSFLAETLRVRRLLERALVRGRPLAGHGPSALVAADARRVLRAPRGPVAALVAAPLVAAAADLYGRAAAAGVLVLLAWAAAASAAGGLRAVTRTPALVRSIPLPDTTIRLAQVALPAAAAGVVGVLATALAGRPAWWVVVAVLVGTTGALRTARGRPPVRWEVQATSPVGALPVGALMSYLVGVDVVALTSLPFLVGAQELGSALLPAVALTVLLRRRPRPVG